MSIWNNALDYYDLRKQKNLIFFAFANRFETSQLSYHIHLTDFQ